MHWPQCDIALTSMQYCIDLLFVMILICFPSSEAQFTTKMADGICNPVHKLEYFGAAILSLALPLGRSRISAPKQQQKVSRNNATKSSFTLRRCVRLSFGTMIAQCLSHSASSQNENGCPCRSSKPFQTFPKILPC